MFCKHRTEIAWIVIWAFCFSSTVLPYKKIDPARKNTPAKTTANLETANGLNTAVFDTDAGQLRVKLPDDIQAGDTISGAVFANPKGKTEAEKENNSSTLSGYVVEIEKQKSGVSNKIVKFELPEKLKNSYIRLTLRNSSGKKLSNLRIPTNPVQADVLPDDFRIPSLGQTGHPLNIRGIFDGDLSNTKLNVGNQSAIPLAESPRKTVFQSPKTVIGPTEISLTEGDTEVTQDFRNINVRLSSPKLQLLRGETTNITVKVEGLNGIEDEVPLHLNCTGSANMQGGNIQNIQISPNQVQSGGIFTTTRTLTGTKVGNFNIAANVLNNKAPVALTNQIVHVEKDPVNIGDENDKVWWLKVKTLDGKIIDIFIKQDFKPSLKVCNWIKINKSEKDNIDRVFVSNFQPVDDPTKPCALTNQIVHIEGNPLKLPDGRWQIKIKMPGGKTGFIYVRSPNKPDLKFCNWIKISGCKKLSSNTFEIDGYGITEDPNKKPPPTVTATPTKPTPEVVPPTVSLIKPCKDGDTRKKKKVTKTFEILDKDSKLSFSISTNAGGGGAAAEGMAAWLGGVSKIGDALSDYIPEGAAVGGAVAGAALQYVKLGGDIIGALAKSKLRNLNVNKVTGKLSGDITKVTAVCTTYEICVNGAWLAKKEYSETREPTYYSKTITVEPKDNGWDQVSVTSKPQFFDPDKAAKYLMTELLKPLKKNEEIYKKFKDNCK